MDTVTRFIQKLSFSWVIKIIIKIRIFLCEELCAICCFFFKRETRLSILLSFDVVIKFYEEKCAVGCNLGTHDIFPWSLPFINETERSMKQLNLNFKLLEGINTVYEAQYDIKYAFISISDALAASINGFDGSSKFSFSTTYTCINLLRILVTTRRIKEQIHKN